MDKIEEPTKTEAEQLTESDIFMAMPPYDMGRFADHTTPLVRNCWYMAGRSSEIGRTPLGRRLLGTDVAMYRKLDGTPVIVQNRCPHRSFPLSKGKLEGDNLVCGYHGMTFESSGRCVRMPAMPITPSNVQISSFPVVECAPVVWVWMGDPDRADESLVPDTSWLSSPDWGTVQGGFAIKCNYIAMHENLLDQTHFAFLHPDTVGTAAYARSKLDVETHGNVVTIHRRLKSSPPPPIYGVPMGLTGRDVDRYSDSHYVSPALHVAFACIVNPHPREDERREFRVNITHIFTPENQDSLHYWWFNSRDFNLTSEEADIYLRDNSAKAYLEDVDALQWINEVVHNNNDGAFELNFAPDKPALLMRRNIYHLAMAEQAG